jgi:hypothetical protein
LVYFFRFDILNQEKSGNPGLVCRYPVLLAGFPVDKPAIAESEWNLFVGADI